MLHQKAETQFRPLLSAEDLTLILSALSAYMHNTRYRPVYERLHYQASRLGLAPDTA
ncbi:hypothetical protein SAMN04489859_1003133 [Paracoccus alcaliphilus]|uniref:Uncharacterized protein n=1 Tax=Paracoccus alcaliphilus TaxID=34002 RepID=A0A1H8F347_9RHOB|nr:hypothetical protein [Paracoccus alcaliphilus]WCR20385.1 hypothetical protein JHW40_19175 [Paracoccus alcaliphilus]SEN26149.1 hypothetical protein SAMN04489859_1003133 [Paracoccus alcaliphilus]